MLTIYWIAGRIIDGLCSKKINIADKSGKNKKPSKPYE